MNNQCFVAAIFCAIVCLRPSIRLLEDAVFVLKTPLILLCSLSTYATEYCCCYCGLKLNPDWMRDSFDECKPKSSDIRS